MNAPFLPHSVMACPLVQIRYHFIRQIVELGKAMIKYVPTNQQIADGLTKSLKSEKQASFVAMLGLKELKE